MTENKNTFVRWILAITPRWLRQPYGLRLTGSLGLMGDALAEGARQAVRARWILEDTPPDHLPHIGAHRHLPQLPTEAEATYRAILGRPWELHGRAGSPDSVVEHCERLAQVTIQTGGGPVDVTGYTIDEAPGGAAIEDFEYAIVLGGIPLASCNPWVFDSTLPDFDSPSDPWVFDNGLPGNVVQAYREIAGAWGPKRSKFVAVLCGGP